MMWARHKTLIAVAAAVLLAGLVAGAYVALRHDRQVRGAAAPSPSPSRAAQLRSPFTGEPVPSLNRVLAVKIDNIVPARPQTGLARADIVYVLPVEGGLSRLMAIFSSHYPPVIGPVRSAREDDLQLLRQFGRPAFAYSGAQPQLLPVVQRRRIVDLYAAPAAATSGTRAGSRRTTCTRTRGAAGPGAAGEHGPRHRVPVRPAAARAGRPRRSVPVSYPAASFRSLVGRRRALAGLDGRHPARSARAAGSFPPPRW